MEKTTDQIAKRLAAESTVSPADVKAVLEALSGVMGDYMAQGRSVKLDGIGSFFFQSSATGNGKDKADIMYVQMGEETDSAYQVVFRSYTGAFVNFYVNKKSGTTRMEEHVPTLDIRNEAGTIDIFDYLEEQK